MKPVVCPTVTATNTRDYSAQLTTKAQFADRIHIDLMDGVFAPTKSPELSEIWWPQTCRIDLHLMYEHPEEVLEEIVALKPTLAIIHAEADVRHAHFANKLHENGIKSGLAVLPETSIGEVKTILPSFDHILIFSGNLGHHGGSNVDFGLLDKVKEIKKIYPEVEIGWDGGVNNQNIRQLVNGDIDVLNVGGYIENSKDQASSFQILKKELGLV